MENNMMDRIKNKLILIVALISLSISHTYPQGIFYSKKTPEFISLDKNNFKWKEFSFNQSWLILKNNCYLEKIESYSDSYLNFYCGNISDSSKSYHLQNKSYHDFNNIQFDEVILNIRAPKIFNVNNGQHFISISQGLCFVKKLQDSSSAYNSYKAMLKLFRSKYGYTSKQILTKNNETPSGTFSLNENNPFSNVEESTWGGSNIRLTLNFIKGENLILFQVEKSFGSKNWFADSNYDENFTDTFKEFDKRNGYKKLKFGMSKITVRNIVKLKAPDALKQYQVVTSEYKNWFYIPFEECMLSFNRKEQLFDISLEKDEFSKEDYEKFLKELVQLFGNATRYKDKRDDGEEFTYWEGKNITIIVMRPNYNTIYVSFSSLDLNDSSPSDKLY